MDGVDDLGAVDSLEVNARDAEVGVPELPLDDDEWDAFVGHLDRVRVPQLMLVPTSAQSSLCRPSGYADVSGTRLA
jgi:hypothetical protein